MGDWDYGYTPNPYQTGLMGAGFQPMRPAAPGLQPKGTPAPAPQGTFSPAPAPTRYGGGGDSAGDPVWGSVYQPVYTPPPVTPGGSPNVSVLRQPTQYQTSGSPGEAGPQFQDPMQQAQQDAVRQQVYKTAKIAPGVAPNIGVLPDGTPINLTSFNPYTGPTNAHAPQFTGFDPQTQMLLDLAARSPKIPKFSDLSPGPVPDNSGYGYKLGGTASPQEDELWRRAQRGDLRAAQRLADLRSQRITSAAPQGRFPQGLKDTLRNLDLAFMAAGFGAVTGGAAAGLGAGSILAGGIGGAAGSAGTQAIAKHGHVNPYGVLLGAAGGAAVPGLSALGVNPILAGAATGAATGGLSGPAQGRPFNPMDVVAGAAGGAAGGGVSQIPNVGPLAAPVIGNATGQGVNALTGNRPKPPQPRRRVRARPMTRVFQRNPYHR